MKKLYEFEVTFGDRIPTERVMATLVYQEQGHLIFSAADRSVVAVYAPGLWKKVTRGSVVDDKEV